MYTYIHTHIKYTHTPERQFFTHFPILLSFYIYAHISIEPTIRLIIPYATSTEGTFRGYPFNCIMEIVKHIEPLAIQKFNCVFFMVDM